MGYPYFENWKNCVDENTVVLIDGDQSAYVLAAANESRTIEVTHKQTGRKKEFKNRTEFYGNKKTTLGGWLADTNIQREIKNLPLFTKEDFDNLVDFEYNKELVCINHNNVILFLEDEGNLEEIKRDKIIYYVESNYFHFLTLNRDRDTLEKRYCHHDEANLEIEELEYLGLE